MKVVHLACIAPPEIGGIGRAAAREVELLCDRGIEATLVSLTTHAGFRLGNGGSVHALEHLVCEADVVHLHYPFYGTAGKAARLRRAGIIKRLIVTLHMDAMATGPWALWFNFHRRFLQPGILSAADTLIVSSRDYAEHSSYAGVASRAVELPFGVDEATFCPAASPDERNSWRVRFGIPLDVSCALFVGGMDRPHAFKGVDVLLRALAEVQRVHLALVGDGVLRKTYERLASDLGIKERCHFLGVQPLSDLVGIYRMSDIFVLPSTSQAEAFGLVALEAQACGLPAVVSYLPGVRTVIEDGMTGRLVAPRDAAALAKTLRELCGDTALRQRMGEAARRRIEARYTWTKHADELVKIYAHCSFD